MPYHESTVLWKNLLQAGLEDDDWEWDWTSIGTLGARSGKRVRAQIVCKAERGVWAATGLNHAIEVLSRELSSPIRVRTRARDGDVLRRGSVVADWYGPARVLLALERPYLNLAAYSSGIATRTRTLVDQVRRSWPKKAGPPPLVTATRKILPCYRDIAIHAVQVGGGHSHRVSLSGGILIKENHIAAAGGVERSISRVRQKAPHGLRVEIEVRSLAELDAALRAGADGVLLDNFTPKNVREATAFVAKANYRPLVEISGGLNEENIGQYAVPGVDVLSVGSLTHSVQALDLSLLVK